ncbi:3-hydroxyacyl-CoA dehydrogenase NAD-binding domain-containing protein [Streptomyces capitiformicae]|uniref:3-hydroxyacyl-CoA dehydrogenase NAD binding domain-containing protein n=1 Tax=Streptomyces capitiformicae TaxID=2014920 RepID=A0A918ZQH1_9ACTN|nr:hypothetical protein GCM10017771_89150 [Streptomyces capitiformicae]
MTTPSRIGVVGCGLMGSGIAETVARSGLDVLVTQVGRPAVAAGAAVSRNPSARPYAPWRTAT